MPLPMIHLSVAYKINLPKCLKSPAFYLGSISPDAVHMRSGAEPSDKVKSHCNTREIATIGELAPLCEKINLSENEEKSFLIGYLVHILTDLYWGDSVQPVFKKHYLQDSSPVQDRRMAYYNDTDQLDFEFYKREKWRPEVWKLLKQAEGFSAEGMVSQQEVFDWKNRTLNWYNSGKSQHSLPVKYISYEDLDRFTDYAARKCEEYLHILILRL